LDELKDAASKCLEKAISETMTSFSVGTATSKPIEFDIKDGMGSGGITAVVVKVDEQRTAYVVIDGNNMVPGLREKILSLLNSIGFDEGEVFTTDSHAVSGLSVGKRGYHPIGEKMDERLLLDHIKNAVLSASERLEKCNANTSRIIVPEIRVIGEDLLESISNLVDRSIQRAKRILLPTFAIEGVVLIALILLL
jgi:putative membrane protein